ncbi:hypothetical protein PCK2_000814 [Pneumocystis canis]|nr:hypothetical protein PCK2_000814 [Pneumocystis canis]
MIAELIRCVQQIAKESHCGGSYDLRCLCDSDHFIFLTTYVKSYPLCFQKLSPSEQSRFPTYFQAQCAKATPTNQECIQLNSPLPPIPCSEPYKGFKWGDPLYECLKHAASESHCKKPYDAHCLCDSQSHWAGVNKCLITADLSKLAAVQELRKSLCHEPLTLPGCSGLPDVLPECPDVFENTNLDYQLKICLRKIAENTHCGGSMDPACLCDSKAFVESTDNSNSYAECFTKLSSGAHQAYFRYIIELCKNPKSPSLCTIKKIHPGDQFICFDLYKDTNFDKNLQECLTHAAKNSLCKRPYKASCLSDSRSYLTAVDTCINDIDKEKQKQVHDFLKSLYHNPASLAGCSKESELLELCKDVYETSDFSVSWTKNRRKGSPETKKVSFVKDQRKNAVKNGSKTHFNECHSINQSNSSLHSSFSKKPSKKVSGRSSCTRLCDSDDVFEPREGKRSIFWPLYQKKYKSKISRKKSTSFSFIENYSNPLTIPIDKNARYPKIAGKHRFKAIKKSHVSGFLKKVFCFTYFANEKVLLNPVNSEDMSPFLYATSPIMSPRPLSSVSLSSLNAQQKLKELPQKKHDYLFMENIYVPGRYGFGSAIELSDWINDKLSVRTRQRLSNELKRSISTNDKPGYIYVFNLQPSDKITPYSLEKMIIKIGRASNIQRRLNQWPKQCNFIPELIEYFPSNNDCSKHCIVSHRIERLIHIELQDKFLCKPQTCIPCGISHREWFYIPNFAAWNEVKQTIEKWVLFSFIAYGKT